jgi:ornithine cyclodeaminase
MEKFRLNLSTYDLQLQPCASAQDAVTGVDIITTLTADKHRNKILCNDWIEPGVHINAVGGDCPGKTELETQILDRCHIVVEYMSQSRIEGEIQAVDSNRSYTELWQLISQVKPGRTTDDEITLFDSVGFALEDYSVLKYVHQLSEQYSVGESLVMLPSLQDPKDLFSLL